MSFITPLRAAVAVLSLALPVAANAEDAHFGVHDTFAATAYPGAPTGAVYLTLHNYGMPDDALVDATSPLDASVMLHTNIETADGVMQMRHLDRLDVPTDGFVTFAPGGNHIMFMGLTEPWQDGDVIPVTLVFDSGATLDITAIVGPRPDMPGMDHEDMDHDTMDHSSMEHGTMDHGTMTHETMDANP